MPRGYHKDGTPTKPSFKGRKHTPETLLKMSLAKKGRKWGQHTPETIQKMRQSNLKGTYGFKKGEHRSPKTEFKKGHPAPMKGKPRPDLIGNTNGFKKGSTPWNKGLGTKSSVNELARKTLQARLWRKAVYERDDYTCQECGVRGGELHADHIKQFAYYPELRYEVDNGRTLCVDCHRSTDTWGLKLTKVSLN